MRRLLVACLGMVLVGLAGCGHRAPAETDVLNTEAKLPAGLPVPAMDWRVISSSVDRAHGTMATLTGNEVAWKYSGTGTYPEGSELALMTWLQRDDPHWFGARVPGSFAGLETVTVVRGADGKIATVYRRYAGEPLREVTDAASADARKAVLLGMRYSVMP
jgi:hypothetical protein